MLIMSVAISCCRVIASSGSVSPRILGAAEDSDTDLGDKRQRDSTRLRPPQIYITPSSSSPPTAFHLSISLYPGLLTLIAAFFSYDWEIYNPISVAALPVAGTTHIKITKNTHTCIGSRKEECVHIKLTSKCFFSPHDISCERGAHEEKLSLKMFWGNLFTTWAF